MLKASIKQTYLPIHTSFHIRLHQGTTSQQFCHIPASEELLVPNTEKGNRRHSFTVRQRELTKLIDGIRWYDLRNSNKITEVKEKYNAIKGAGCGF